MQQIDIEAIRAVELEILDEFHRVCEENHLRYSLAYGTLIGAVRHQGFIPWDDDIDLMMPREDYEELLRIWDHAADKKYLLRNKRNEPGYTQNITKIRKDHTAFVQSRAEMCAPYHTGIFIDIFPGDRVAPKGIRRSLQYVSCMINLLFSRGYKSKSGGVTGLLEGLMLKLPERFRYRVYLKTERSIARYQNTNREIFFPCTLKDSKLYYPADLFDSFEKMDFCGRKYNAVSDYDTALRTEYGDYMQLPPEEERVWTHHPLVVDLERNSPEIVEETH